MQQFIHMVNEMSPYLLLGFLLAGLMHSFIPGTIYSRYLSKPNFTSVLLAALFGIPLPLCSCGVIPTAMSLRRQGASKGATTSFLIATPQTGIDSIIATFSLMGLPFAIIRPIAALATALFGGEMVNMIEGKGGAGTPCGNGEVTAHCDCDCSCSDHDHETHHSFTRSIIEALRYAYIDMMQDIGKWLITGLVIAGLITQFVPESYFEVFKDNSLTSMLLVLSLSIPMYLCATGSIPIAVALMMKGLTPGAALVMLMAGPACNMASILVINKVMGRRTLIIYLSSIIAGAVSFGLAIDHLLPRPWFITDLIAPDTCCSDHDSWFATSCTIILVLLLINALVIPRLKGKKHYAHGNDENEGHCHCHEGKADNVDHCHCHEDKADNVDHCHCHEENADHCLAHEDKTDVASSSRTFTIEGMNCNHCRLSAEKAILSVPGIIQASVDLSSKTATVTGNAADEDVCQAVESLGFRCSRQ